MLKDKPISIFILASIGGWLLWLKRFTPPAEEAGPGCGYRSKTHWRPLESPTYAQGSTNSHTTLDISHILQLLLYNIAAVCRRRVVVVRAGGGVGNVASRPAEQQTRPATPALKMSSPRFFSYIMHWRNTRALITASHIGLTYPKKCSSTYVEPA